MATSTELFLNADDAARFRTRGWWRDETIVDDLRRAAESRPGHPAIVAHRDGAVRVIAYAELAALTDRFAGALLELGVRPGDIVTIEMPNWWQLPVLYLACARVGAVVNPVQPIMRSRELGFILQRTESRVCVVPDAWRGFSYAGMLAQLTEAVPTLEHCVVIGDADIPRGVDFEHHFVREPWEERHPAAELDRLAPAADDVAQVMFTSGTTGEPKGAVHTHNTLLAAMRCEPHALGLDGGDVVHMGSPMTHQAGFLYCHFMP
ncbi:MAG TPA: AMP-binding protein, partial [Candidatus Dormibacteraeota bacterium]|nr:AMP-binding protein [Candidatus Dormibacteraeota bacterium]